MPVKLGMSVNDYYELNGDDRTFGFLDIGGLVTLPLSKVGSQFGSWNLHGGLDYLALGEATEAFNVNKDFETKAYNFIFSFGIGISY